LYVGAAIRDSTGSLIGGVAAEIHRPDEAPERSGAVMQRCRRKCR